MGLIQPALRPAHEVRAATPEHICTRRRTGLMQCACPMQTALIFAAQHRNWEVVELLVENGAFLAPSAKADDAPEGDMEPPLTARAATNKEEVKQSVAMLKERFANMSAAGASTSMPLETPGRQSIQKGGVAAAAAKFS